MPITPEQPIVVPPTTGETYTQQWVWNMQVNAPQVNEGSVSISLLPFDPVAQTLGDGNLLEIVQTDKLWQAAAEVPEVAAAMQAVINCVGPLRDWIKAQAEVPAEVPAETQP